MQDNNNWVLWFSQQPRAMNPEDYSKYFLDTLIKIVVSDSASQISRIYNYMPQILDLKIGCSFYLFKEGYRPIWEENRQAGFWEFRLARSNLVSEHWKKIIDWCGGNCWGEYVIGVKASGKFEDIVMQVWIKRPDENKHEAFIEIKKCLGCESLRSRFKLNETLLQFKAPAEKLME